MISRRTTLIAGAAFLSMAAVAHAAEPAPKSHRVALHVDENDAQKMNMVLNNAKNITELYGARGEKVEIEIVAYGPGLHMLRADTSPVKDRITAFGQSMPQVTFSACQNTMAGMKKTEGHDIQLLPEATQVPAGVVRLIELQEQGWAYVRP